MSACSFYNPVAILQYLHNDEDYGAGNCWWLSKKLRCHMSRMTYVKVFSEYLGKMEGVLRLHIRLHIRGGGRYPTFPCPTETSQVRDSATPLSINSAASGAEKQQPALAP